MLKRITALFLALFCMTCSLGLEAYALTPPTLAAKGAIVGEMTTNEIVFEQNADERLYPASTTKIMTAILALEYGNLNDIVTVSGNAVKSLENSGSSVMLKEGEQMNMLNMITYLLVASGNDAANALAEHISGSIPAFVELMNNKAKELGCTNTNFVNAHGLHDENHYTTARDLLKIAQYAMKNEKIVASMQKSTIKTPVTNKHKTQTTLGNTNLLTSSYKQVGLIGGKTGSTTAAGYCLVAACQEDDKIYYSVLLDCDTTTLRFSETKALFKFGKESFSVQTLLSATEPICEAPVRLSSKVDSVMLVPEHSISALLPNDFDAKAVELEYSYDKDITAPVAVGDALGKVNVRYNGHEYGQVKLVAASKVERNTLLYVLDQVTSFFSGTLFKVILIALIVLVVLFVGYVVLSNKRRKRRNRSGGGTRRSHGRYKGRH